MEMLGELVFNLRTLWDLGGQSGCLHLIRFFPLMLYSLSSSCILSLGGYGEEKSVGKSVSVVAFCLQAIILSRKEDGNS